MKHMLVILAAAAWVPAAAEAAFVSEVWGNDPQCQHQGTLGAAGKIAQFDLSALPKGTTIHRAVLKLKLRRENYAETIAIHALSDGQSAPPAGVKSLALRPPLYNSFDTTEAVRTLVARGGSTLRLHMTNVPQWQPELTVLEIAYEGQPRKPPPRVSSLRALHHDGQTFLVWQEHEDILSEFDTITLENMEKKLLPLHQQGPVVYRVYAAQQPITARTLGRATLVAEVPMVLSMYYLDSVRTIEHPDPKKGEGGTPLVGGARAKRDSVPAYVIAKGEKPLARGSGLYVRTITQPGNTFYAVVAAVGGREAVADDGLAEGNSLKQPVAEQPAPPIPVLQSSHEIKSEDKRRKGAVLNTYNYWLEFPYANVPRQLAVATRQGEVLTSGEKGELCVNLGSYGSQPAFIARERGGGEVTLCPPWDQDDSILQGRHECLGTLRSYEQGVVHNWAQRRSLALVAWARREFPVDPERITVVGQFALWAVRHGDLFAVVASDAYGNFNKGREAQKHGWTWGPYPNGCKNWLGIDHWDYMNVCQWIRENPTVELPYLVLRPTSSSHVGDIGPWAWPELYRALHDTKRAFTARHGGVWSGTTLAGSFMPAKIRLHQSLPAFGNCSLDGMPGDGDLSNNGGVGGDSDVIADLNGWILWDTDTIVDQVDRWEITVWLYAGDAPAGKSGAPADTCTVDITPRRCQKFKARLGETFRWTNTAQTAGKVVQSATATADRWGLVTLGSVLVSQGKNTIRISK